LFYSRRIGLDRNRVIPIDVGGRVTGKVGEFGIGLLNIQTGDERVSATPSTNFSVVRLKRDILRRSSIGAIVTNRSESTVATGSNQAYGVDSSFSFFENLNLGAFFARTSTPGLRDDDVSYQGKFNYAGDQYGAQAEHLHLAPLRLARAGWTHSLVSGRCSRLTVGRPWPRADAAGPNGFAGASWTPWPSVRFNYITTQFKCHSSFGSDRYTV
jgi:hypothetical protein